jgi:hypothetical protein
MSAVDLAAFLLASASPTPLPNFEFRGIVAGQAVDPAALKGCRRDAETVTCRSFATKVAGNDAAIESVEYTGGKLSALRILLDRSAYASVVEAFSARYGEPCSSSTDKWANAIGARLDNLSIRWCFLTGNLEARQIGPSLKYMAVAYTDANQPIPKPQVDF